MGRMMGVTKAATSEFAAMNSGRTVMPGPLSDRSHRFCEVKWKEAVLD